ncbi:hypothetical protein NDN08_004245 [Rhodosorus marinus]|uniref:Uncharacterized protein n=1 Tax=Rhodosorus marinus TaxID=101924 RepID=A0AAV8UNG9_9RHOD|nr:hypothetical protein NDN08_004245 [Rhodosorus marinus]
MLPVRFLLVLPMFALFAAGTWTSARPCTEFTCENVCILNDSCEPLSQKFNKECDDLYWGQMGLPNPDPEDICTQCCDESCDNVQTFPNCTGEQCNQCYDGPRGDESTETYDLECCKVDGELRCAFKCSEPEGWNADWAAELENRLPDNAVLTTVDDDSCGDAPVDVQCSTRQVSVESAEESCELTRDLRCRGWYLSERTPNCQRCLPSWKKAQFISSSFERLTVLCKPGEAATCEKVPAGIVRIALLSPPRPCEIDLNGAYFSTGRVFSDALDILVHVGDPEDASTNRIGRAGLKRISPFTFSYDPSSQRLRLSLGLVYATGSSTTGINRSGAIIDPVTGDVKDHEICELLIRAEGGPGNSAIVSVENLQLEIGGTEVFDLGTFSHNSDDGGSTLVKFCRDDYGGGFVFTGDIELDGELGDWTVQIQCGTRPLT